MRKMRPASFDTFHACTSMAFSSSDEDQQPPIRYRVTKIPKRAGAFRHIYIAHPEDNLRLRGLLPKLEKVLASADGCRANYAFERGKNCALNAFQHLGRRYTLSMDLEDFFDSVTPSHVADLLPPSIIQQCFIDGNPKQGLPTSPLIATIAFLACDKLIVQLLSKLGVEAIYTRYADDLIFSFDDIAHRGKILTIVRQVLETHGFRLNSRKTRLQDAKNGRRVVTGIALDQLGLHSTRRIKGKMRAACHQNKADSLRGLTEWSKCKLPAAITQPANPTSERQ